MTRKNKIILAASFLLSLLALPFVGIVAIYVHLFGDCFRLPSGVEIGYQAYFDLSRHYLKPVAVLREPDGRVIGQEVFPIYLTEKAAYGHASIDYENPRSDFAFIWTAETGLVKRDENPDLYHSLLQDPGEIHYGNADGVYVNTLWVFMKFKKSGAFASDQCHTSWLTW